MSKTASDGVQPNQRQQCLNHVISESFQNRFRWRATSGPRQNSESTHNFGLSPRGPCSRTCEASAMCIMSTKPFREHEGKNETSKSENHASSSRVEVCAMSEQRSAQLATHCWGKGWQHMRYVRTAHRTNAVDVYEARHR